MPSIADILLANGCAFHLEALHGEGILVLSGPDAGKVFRAVKETESDIVLDANLGEDRRSKKIIRFREGNVPQLTNQDRVKTEDGKTWKTVRAPQDGYLTTDFELKEVVTGIDL